MGKPGNPSFHSTTEREANDGEDQVSVSPTPPVVSLEPARLGQFWKRPRRQPARVTRPSTYMMSKIDSDVDYFFLRRALVFFAVFLVAAFVFLFFAIAALLA